ncbi:MAG TPA: FAD:protein FMN transferase [Casimicrobiaceae bacterium]|nr:FAD:protein FMN transferase [Casimicrobiaceae bacterium]
MAAEHAIIVEAADSSATRAAIDAAIGDVHRIEAKYSRYRDDSIVSVINRESGRRAVAIDAETSALLHYADRCHRLSEGRFDITSGVLRRAWNFNALPPRLPSQSEIDALLPMIDWSQVIFDQDSIRLPRQGMEIDLGGIGKEYAADRAATILAGHGIEHALVNLGGDVRALGGQASGAAWRIGVQHPRANVPRAAASIDVHEGAVATSGDYQRYIEVDGHRYCHLIDARSGWPVGAWQSISVVAPLAIIAGSYATIAMLMADSAPDFLAAHEVAWLGIDRNGQAFGTLAH